MRIRDIAMSRPRFGYERIHVLLRREGWHVNLKRVHRLYCLEGLQVRMRVRRKKRMSLHRGPAPTPTAPGQRWSMDFVHDQLVNGQPFRVLTVVDNWSRESPVLEVGFRLTGSSVAEALSRVGKTVRLPACITVDHGTEFTSRALDFWAWENKVQLDFTRPGKPTDNGLCESFNGRLRDECLNTHDSNPWSRQSVSSRLGDATIMITDPTVHLEN
jgi:putative transposase